MCERVSFIVTFEIVIVMSTLCTTTITSRKVRSIRICSFFRRHTKANIANTAFFVIALLIKLILESNIAGYFPFKKYETQNLGAGLEPALRNLKNVVVLHD